MALRPQPNMAKAPDPHDERALSTDDGTMWSNARSSRGRTRRVQGGDIMLSIYTHIHPNFPTHRLRLFTGNESLPKFSIGDQYVEALNNARPAELFL